MKQLSNPKGDRVWHLLTNCLPNWNTKAVVIYSQRALKTKRGFHLNRPYIPDNSIPKWKHVLVHFTIHTDSPNHIKGKTKCDLRILSKATLTTLLEPIRSETEDQRTDSIPQYLSAEQARHLCFGWSRTENKGAKDREQRHFPGTFSIPMWLSDQWNHEDEDLLVRESLARNCNHIELVASKRCSELAHKPRRSHILFHVQTLLVPWSGSPKRKRKKASFGNGGTGTPHFVDGPPITLDQVAFRVLHLPQMHRSVNEEHDAAIYE